MNEASSKYVDQIATEKLINEKLKHVHHAPDPMGSWVDTRFLDFDRLPQQPEEVRELRQENSIEISFLSSVRTKSERNNWVKCRCSLSEMPVGDLIFVHGLFEDNLQIYNFFFSLLNEQGLNVYLLILPYHYDRRPESSAFSGEYFWSGDVQRSAQAHQQAVYDLYQLYYYVKQRARQPVGIVGFSMGGGIALSLAAIAALDGVFAINPVCNISEQVWTSALFATIRQDLETNGITFEVVKDRFRQYEPLYARGVKTSPEKIVLARSLYDQINDSSNYDLLIEKWGLQNVIRYKAGHLNILRVPRLATDVAQILSKK